MPGARQPVHRPEKDKRVTLAAKTTKPLTSRHLRRPERTFLRSSLDPQREHRIPRTAHDLIRSIRYSQIPIARGTIAPSPRGFLPWRLSDDGPGASRIVPMGRHPKPFTEADVARSIWINEAVT
jgi:hypothetical protein